MCSLVLWAPCNVFEVKELDLQLWHCSLGTPLDHFSVGSPFPGAYSCLCGCTYMGLKMGCVQVQCGSLGMLYFRP